MPPRLPEKKKEKIQRKIQGKKTQRHIEHREAIPFLLPFQKKFKKREFFDRFLLSSSSFPLFFSYSSKFLTLYKCGFKELSRAQDAVYYLYY
jgi:hypothetical protein